MHVCSNSQLEKDELKKQLDLNKIINSIHYNKEDESLFEKAPSLAGILGEAGDLSGFVHGNALPEFKAMHAYNVQVNPPSCAN